MKHNVSINLNEEVFQLSLSPGAFEHLISFTENYSVIESYCCMNVQEKKKMSVGKPYVCRFCGKRKPLVSFKKKAHVLPKFFRSNLLSDFECDSCNETFSRYESHFSSLLSFDRAWQGNYSKFSKPIKYKTRNHPQITEFIIPDAETLIQMGFKLEEHPYTHFIKVNLTDNYSGDDIAKDGLVISAKSESFRPEFISKIIHKMAISFLKEIEVEQHPLVFEWLRKDVVIGLEGIPMCIFQSKTLTNYFPLTEFMVFKKTTTNEHLYDYIVVINYLNKSIQIPLLISDSNVKMIQEGKQIIFKSCPYFLSFAFLQNMKHYAFSQEILEAGNLTSFNVDMLSDRKQSLPEVKYHLPLGNIIRLNSSLS